MPDFAALASHVQPMLPCLTPEPYLMLNIPTTSKERPTRHVLQAFRMAILANGEGCSSAPIDADVDCETAKETRISRPWSHVQALFVLPARLVHIRVSKHIMQCLRRRWYLGRSSGSYSMDIFLLDLGVWLITSISPCLFPVRGRTLLCRLHSCVVYTPFLRVTYNITRT